MNAGYVLDDVTIGELGRGDLVVANLVAALDERAVRMSVPAIALAVARYLGFPILAADLKRWEPVRALVPWELDIYEISG